MGWIALFQLSFLFSLFDDLVVKLFDFLRRWFFETAGCAFNHIGETNDGAFLGLRLRPTIAKTFLAHFRNVLFADVRDFSARARVLLLLKRALVEVVNERGAVKIGRAHV